MSAPSRFLLEESWIPSGDGAVRVVLTLPSDRLVTGAVVFGPPLGSEYALARRSLRFLAQEFAARGLACARVDHPGTGESTPDPDPGLDAWVRALDDAADALTDRGLPVALAGLRVGALIAALTTERRDDVRALALWDPIGSGRRHLRTAGALLRLSTGYSTPPGEGADVRDLHLGPRTAADLAAASLPATPHAPVALVHGPDPEPRVRALAAAPETHVLHVEHPEATVTPGGMFSIIPAGALRDLAAWTAATLGRDGNLPPVRLEPLGTRRIGFETPGGRVVEELTALGPNRLPTVVTSCPDLPPRGRVLFTATGFEPRQGPSGLWTQLSRELAVAGFRCYRWDRRGSGDAPPDVAAEDVGVLYDETHRADLADVADAIAADPGPVLAVGMCSGGWASAVMAVRHPRFRLLYLSPQDWLLRRPVLDLDFLVSTGWDPVTTQRVPAPAAPTRMARLQGRLREAGPLPVWIHFARRGRVQYPGFLLSALAERGVEATLVFPHDDWQIFHWDHGPAALLQARLRGRGWRPELVHLRGTHVDHSLRSPAFHPQVREIVTACARRLDPATDPGVSTRRTPTPAQESHPTMSSAPSATPPAASDTARLSAIVPTVGRDSLRHTVDALLAQDRRLDEVIVVANGPSDDAARRVLTGVTDPRLRVVHEPVRGASAARNRGVAESTGDIALFTDDDAVPVPSWSAVVAETFASDPEGYVGAVTGSLSSASTGSADETVEQRWLDSSGIFDHAPSPRVFAMRDRPEWSRLGGRAQTSPFFPLTCGEVGSSNNLAVRRRVLAEVGGFHEHLGAGMPTRGGEDLELLRRIALAGYGIAYRPDAAVGHHHRADAAGFREQMFGYGAGLSAMIWSYVVDDPRHVADIARLVPAGLARLTAQQSRTEEESGDAKTSRDAQPAPTNPAPTDPELARLGRQARLRRLAGFAAGPFLLAHTRRGRPRSRFVL